MNHPANPGNAPIPPRVTGLPADKVDNSIENLTTTVKHSQPLLELIQGYAKSNGLKVDILGFAARGDKFSINLDCKALKDEGEERPDKRPDKRPETTNSEGQGSSKGATPPAEPQSQPQGQ